MPWFAACVFFLYLTRTAAAGVPVANISGSGAQIGVAAGVDSYGNHLMVGHSDSTEINISGLLPVRCFRSTDIVLAAFRGTGNIPLWARCFGGSWDDRATAMAVAADGSIYIAGFTNSPDFPGANQSARGTDGFVMKVSANGTTVIWTVLIGGASEDRVRTLAVGGSGALYVGGETRSSDLPLVRPVQIRLRGESDAFVVRLNAQTGVLVFSTFLGGSGMDRALAVAVDPGGNVYAAGMTTSGDLPSVAAFQPVKAGPMCGFISKLSGDGSQIVYSSYVCGSSGLIDGSEQVNAVAVTATGIAYIGGVTSSADFPLANAWQTSFHGWNTDAFLAAVAQDGRRLLFSTYFGGGQWDSIVALQLDEVQGVTAAGSTMSMDLPGAADSPGAFLARFSTAGQHVRTTALQGEDLTATGLAPAPGHILVVGTRTAMSGATTSAFLAAIPKTQSQIIWTNDTTRQATIWQLRGERGALSREWAWIHVAGAAGWRIVAIGDFNWDGVTDLIWQEDATGKVTIWYQNGPMAAANVAWRWLHPGGAPGWSIVGCGDFNRDGRLDVVWQNEASRQVTVWYMGGVQGDVNLGWDWIHNVGAPGWRVSAVADMDRDGSPDLIWQHDITRQVTVWYMGGTQGTQMRAWQWIHAASVTGWRVAGAVDVDQDGLSDVIWQNDATGQLTVWYMAGRLGVEFAGWEWVNNASPVGWTVTAAK